MLSTVVLAVVGIVLLGLPAGRTAAPPSPAAAPSHRRATAGTPSTASVSPAAPSHSATPPPHGEGKAGDRAIQRTLETAWPTDLPVADQQRLIVLGRSLLRADATGIGRARWQRIFGAPQQALAPAFAAARFRVQAVIARRDGAASRAVVHLVWAGTDRGGTFTDGRITDLYFTRTISKGVSTWTPRPRH
ncbi:hypothetical protein [Streptomyces aureus]|uniref:hypothetical protein n=1 Tax=Streptomyces aureus TaxID=193461 RepID=UPI0033E6A536